MVNDQVPRTNVKYGYLPKSGKSKSNWANTSQQGYIAFKDKKRGVSLPTLSILKEKDEQ